MKKLFLSTALLGVILVSAPEALAASSNLIVNPSVETASAADPNIPNAWNTDFWGINAQTFTYPVAGFDGSKAVRVSISSYLSGDAKWIADDVAVTPGVTYTFSDMYTANATSSIVAHYTSNTNAESYGDVALTVPPSASWKKTSYNITPPPGTKSLSVMHLLNRVGTLTTDLYSIVDSNGTAGTSTSTNLISNPSLEAFDTNGQPTDWFADGWGTNNAKFSYTPVSSDGASAGRVEITNYTDGDAKWFFKDVAVTPNKQYAFSDFYQASVPTFVVIRYTMSDGSFLYVDLPNAAASSMWKKYSASFTVPDGAVSATIFHLLAGVGSLTVDSYSLTAGSGSQSGTELFPQGMVTLTFDDGWPSHYTTVLPMLNKAGLKGVFGIISQNMITREPGYMNTSQVREIEAAGNEIAAHTQTHPSLTMIPDAQMQAEVNNSKSDLLNSGINSVQTFLYPYGDYNANVIAAVKNAGYIGARSVDRGYNTKTTDKYALKIQQVDITVTAADVQAWIDQAVASRTWLILMYHQVDHEGGQYSTTPEILQANVDYLVSHNVPVVTLSQGISMM